MVDCELQGQGHVPEEGFDVRVVGEKLRAVLFGLFWAGCLVSILGWD